jgi:hypothetical protein
LEIRDFIIKHIIGSSECLRQEPHIVTAYLVS